MKTIFAFAVLSLSLTSFAGTIRMIHTDNCSSTVSKRTAEETQKAELTKCAEGRAHSGLSKKCGNGWLLESEIAQRDYKSFNDGNDRTMTVSAMAVGRCEF